MSENKASRGSVPQIILNTLLGGDKYGYEICKEIESRTNGAIVLKQPSLYSSLRRMEEQGLISSFWEDSDIGGRRHYYKLTEKGIQKANADSESSPAEDNNQKVEKIDQSNDSKEPSFSILKQESLFNVKPTKDIPVIQQQEEDATFVQYDLFNTETKVIKSNAEKPEALETVTNKYIEEDEHLTTIQPEKPKFEKVDIAQLRDITSFNNILQEEKTPLKEEDGVFTFDINSLSGKTEKNKEQEDIITSSAEEIKEESPAFEDSIEENKQSNEEIEEQPVKSSPQVSDGKYITERIEDLVDPNVIENNIYLRQSGVPSNEYRTADEHNPIKYVQGSESDGSYILNNKKPVSTGSYQDILNNLFSTDKELDLDNINSGEPADFHYNDIDNSDTLLKELDTKLKSEGIKLKQHTKVNSKFYKPQDNYINYNQLKMVESFSVYGIMLIEIWLTYMILALCGLKPVNQINIYIIASSVTLAYPLFYLILYIINPDKKLESHFRLNTAIFNKFLAALITIVFVFSINLFMGMTALNQLDFLSSWLVPTILATNFVVSSLIYYLLIKSKWFAK